MIFRKKPIMVEAHQFTMETKDQVYHWASSLQMNVTPSTDEAGNPTLIIPTLDGEMIAYINDYIIREPFPTDWRKVYPCKLAIFQLTYDVIPDSFFDERPLPIPLSKYPPIPKQ